MKQTVFTGCGYDQSVSSCGNRTRTRSPTLTICVDDCLSYGFFVPLLRLPDILMSQFSRRRQREGNFFPIVFYVDWNLCGYALVVEQQLTGKNVFHQLNCFECFNRSTVRHLACFLFGDGVSRTAFTAVWSVSTVTA